MKTLSDFKKRVKVGQTWSAFNHLLNKDFGIRTIKTVQSNAISFHTPNGESWLYYPKATNVKASVDTVQIFNDDDVLVLTYRLVNET